MTGRFPFWADVTLLVTGAQTRKRAMPTLYKRADSQYYQATLRNFRGERVRVSLKTASKREAQRRLRTLIDEQGKPQAMTEVEAMYILRKLRGEIGALSVRGWLGEWVEDISAPAVKWATYRAYKNAAGLLCGYLGKRAEMPIWELSLADLTGFREMIRAQGRAPKTCNNIIKYLRAAFGLAVKLGHIDRNPAELIKPYPIDDCGRRAFTEEELKKLICTATGDWLSAVMLGLYTGQRLSDVVSVCWEDLDMEGGLWVLRQGKTGKVIHAPLASPLMRHLRAFKHRKGYVMPTLAKRRTGGKHGTHGGGLSDSFGRLLVRAGIQRRAYRENCRRVYDVSFHSLRHTFDTMLAMRGVTVEERESLGIAEGRTHKVYTHLPPQYLRGLVNRLPTL